MNKSTSCWRALGRIFPNGQTAPELLGMVLPSLTFEAADAEHSESECQNRLSLAISAFQIIKKNCYTIQLSMYDCELTEFEKENRGSYLIISFNCHEL